MWRVMASGLPRWGSVCGSSLSWFGLLFDPANPLLSTGWTHAVSPLPVERRPTQRPLRNTPCASPAGRQPEKKVVKKAFHNSLFDSNAVNMLQVADDCKNYLKESFQGETGQKHFAIQSVSRQNNLLLPFIFMFPIQAEGDLAEHCRRHFQLHNRIVHHPFTFHLVSHLGCQVEEIACVSHAVSN